MSDRLAFDLRLGKAGCTCEPIEVPNAFGFELPSPERDDGVESTDQAPDLVLRYLPDTEEAKYVVNTITTEQVIKSS